MTQVVKAQCPHCKKMLRIPADWVTQPMKCKLCQKIFQARAKNSKTPFPASGKSLDDSPFQFTLAPRRKKSGVLRRALLLGLVLGIGYAVLFFAGPHLSTLFNSRESITKDPVAEVTHSPKIDPKIVDPPNKKEPDPVKKIVFPKTTGELFPRRALLINVSNYLLFNPLYYGSPRDNSSGKYPGSNTAVLADTLNRPPLNIPATQITELSDMGRNAFAASKGVIEKTITDFVDSCRGQDRVLVLFTGHAIEIDKEAYLVPVEGNREDAKTLIPLKWVYDRLAQCKAQEKILILDGFRYPPARGEELPGSGEMTEDFDAKLLKPPTGVQVWSSCIKGQQSIELEGGSVFMQALCSVLQERLPGIQEPSNPLPLENLVAKVNKRLKEILGPQKLEQVSRMSGTHQEPSVAFDPTEPLPPKLVLQIPTPTGGQNAGLSMVKNIIEELNHLPPVRASQKPVQVTSLPAFSAKALEDYQPDYKNWAELVGMAKDKEKYPLRAAVLKAIQVLQESEKIAMRESLTNPGGAITPQIKNQFAATQKEPGMMIFQMEGVLTELKIAGEKREAETSKRWLANYDYAMARLQSRLVYIYEYNNILAQVRSDSLPPLEPIHNGWRVGSQKKVQISEPKVKDMVKNINKTWKRIAEENPGTPWAILAARENMTALGLVWRPSRE